MSWSDESLKMYGEDDFIILFPVNSQISVEYALQQYFLGISGFEGFIHAIPENGGAAVLRKNAEVEKLKCISNSVNAVYQWYNFLISNQRETITGSEYWSLVPRLLDFRNIQDLGKHDSVIHPNGMYTPPQVQRWAIDMENSFKTIENSLISPLYNDIQLIRLGIGLDV